MNPYEEQLAPMLEPAPKSPPPTFHYDPGHCVPSGGVPSPAEPKMEPQRPPVESLRGRAVQQWRF